MGFIKAITEFLESIFKHSSPEVQKKQQLKKLEAEIRAFIPPLYKDNMLLPNFAEAVNSLYRNTKPLDDLFSRTVSPSDHPKRQRFEAQLVLTGYSEESQDAFDKLEYNKRKEEVLEEPRNPDRIYTRHRKIVENLMKELNSEGFKRMDSDILQLRQFVDFCHISFLPILQVFDPNYQAFDNLYEPSYSDVPISRVINLLEDLYYQTVGLRLTTSTADLVLALASLSKGEALSVSEKELYMGALKKINFIITKVLMPERLKLLIRYAKLDLEYEPKVAAYTGSPRQEFSNLYQSKFNAEESRMRSEIQDERISHDVSSIFKDIPLVELAGYDSATNDVLVSATSLSFKYVLPLRIMKTFLREYVSASVKSLLNDIVIEGFFNNPTYKSEFSALVYSVIAADNEISEFESTFADGQPNSTAVMKGYIQDSHKDKDFYRKLEKMVNGVNVQAQKLLQGITTSLYALYKDLGALLEDAKKPSSELISNLKVLMFSSRNRDNTTALDAKYQDWKIFFDIMKNYVIINDTEK